MKGKPSLPSKRALALPEFSYKIRVPQEREREKGKKNKNKKTHMITVREEHAVFQI